MCFLLFGYGYLIIYVWVMCNEWTFKLFVLNVIDEEADLDDIVYIFDVMSWCGVDLNILLRCWKCI